MVTPAAKAARAAVDNPGAAVLIAVVGLLLVGSIGRRVADIPGDVIGGIGRGVGRALEEAEDFAFGLDVKPGVPGGEIDVRDAPVLARDFFRGVFRDPEEEFIEAGEVQPVIVPRPRPTNDAFEAGSEFAEGAFTFFGYDTRRAPGDVRDFIGGLF